MQPENKDLDISKLIEKEIFALDKRLYDICKEGDYWDATMIKQILNDFQISLVARDDAVHVKKYKCGETIGITVTYIDDSLNSETPEF